MQFFKRLFPHHKQGHLGMCTLCQHVQPTLSSKVHRSHAQPLRPTMIQCESSLLWEPVVSERNKAACVRQILLPKLPKS